MCGKAKENTTKDGLDTITALKLKKRIRKKLHTLEQKAAKKPVRNPPPKGVDEGYYSVKSEKKDEKTDTHI